MIILELDCKLLCMFGRDALAKSRRSSSQIILLIIFAQSHL